MVWKNIYYINSIYSSTGEIIDLQFSTRQRTDEVWLLKEDGLSDIPDSRLLIL